MSNLIYAPWTEEQVAALNQYQNSGSLHPYTCSGEGSCRDRLGTTNPDSSYNDHVLIATKEGWICLTCDRMQTWAHAGSLSWRNILAEGPQIDLKTIVPPT